jgi:hydroxymethylpyrimidine kinase / phosphomethylpyrimidine kinase / thiamine-phosphate diphosphorylase
MKIALSIAGSDSSAGAGIQADLKTFSSLGVYGCTALTTITSQTGSGISGILQVSPKMIEKQIQAILDDITPDAIKIGMVYGKNAISSIRKVLKESKIPMILDPVMIAGTGERLLNSDAVTDLITHLLPLSTVATPNKFEAEVISGLKINSVQSAITAAEKIKKKGANNVVLKGGHLPGRFSTDIILNSRNHVFELSNHRLTYDRMHGGGCTFSASLTAYVAKNYAIVDACRSANQFTHSSLRNRIVIGSKFIINSPFFKFYELADRYEVYNSLQHAVEMIEATPDFGKLIPETQSNLAYSISEPSGIDDIMAVKGRIVKVGDNAKPVSSLKFGVSKHIAAAILGYMKFRPNMRSAMNIKYNSRSILEARRFFSVSNYDRTKEPKQSKRREGYSVSWGINQALLKNPTADIIYHEGDFGKEAMTIVFAPTPIDVVKKLKHILRYY